MHLAFERTILEIAMDCGQHNKRDPERNSHLQEVTSYYGQPGVLRK